MDVLGIGLAGKSLSDFERKILRDETPYAVVLFGRNIADAKQLRELSREVKSIARRPPILMIDEEGGRVDRLRHLLPGLPSAEAFSEGEQSIELASWMGKVIGMALRYFDIEVNLAPVVDIRGQQAPKGLERRTFGSDASHWYFELPITSATPPLRWARTTTGKARVEPAAASTARRPMR